MDCLFCAIVAGAIPADVVREEPDLLAFRDIAPQAPVHVLLIPKLHFATIGAVAAADPGLASRLLASAVSLAEESGVADDGFRLVINTGEHGGQTVDHAHIHLLAGRHLGWPPG